MGGLLICFVVVLGVLCYAVVFGEELCLLLLLLLLLLVCLFLLLLYIYIVFNHPHITALVDWA